MLQGQVALMLDEWFNLMAWKYIEYIHWSKQNYPSNDKRKHL